MHTMYLLCINTLVPQRFRKFHKRYISTSFQKFRKYSGKFPENSWENFRKTTYVFITNAILQSKNLFFYFYKSKENQRNFREKFPENFRNSENSRKFSRKIPGKIPENSRKIGVFFEVNRNDTARKSFFLFL